MRVGSGWYLCLSLNRSLITGWLLTAQHTLNALLKALYQAHHWLWVSAGALHTGMRMPPLLAAQAIPPAVKCRLHIPLDAPATSCLYHLCTAGQCDCALQLSSFYREKHFFPRNQKCKDQVFKVLFGGDCAGRKNKNPLSNLPDSKNIIFHISRHN